MDKLPELTFYFYGHKRQRLTVANGPARSLCSPFYLVAEQKGGGLVHLLSVAVGPISCPPISSFFSLSRMKAPHTEKEIQSALDHTDTRKLGSLLTISREWKWAFIIDYYIGNQKLNKLCAIYYVVDLTMRTKFLL